MLLTVQILKAITQMDLKCQGWAYTSKTPPTMS